jgi:quercetin dioxygenase-like cupin family protein
MTKALEEKDFAKVGAGTVTFRADDIKASADFRADYVTRPNVIKSEDMPFEQTADGYIKHLIHNKMRSPEMCIEAYMLFLKQNDRSGKHRHMWEEVIFVAEGSGYDLHWDFQFDCIEEFEWKWDETPKKFEWKRGDFIYVPPFVTHQHFSNPDSEARLIVISNRIFKEIGFDWFDQLEDAPQ